MVRRRVEWNGSINSRECLLSSRGGIPPGRGRERRKGIKTIDRELVPGRRFSLARASCGTRERRREGRRSLEKRKKERKEERKKEKRRNGRSNNTVHKDSAERLVPAINTNTIAITTTTGVISFSFSSRNRWWRTVDKTVRISRGWLVGRRARISALERSVNQK